MNENKLCAFCKNFDSCELVKKLTIPIKLILLIQKFIGVNSFAEKCIYYEEVDKK